MVKPAHAELDNTKQIANDNSKNLGFIRGNLGASLWTIRGSICLILSERQHQAGFFGVAILIGDSGEMSVPDKSTIRRLS